MNNTFRNMLPYYIFLVLHEYSIPRFNGFPSNRENKKSRMPNFFLCFFLLFTYIKKIKADFKIRKMCFTRFLAEINSLCLIRNFHYCINYKKCPLLSVKCVKYKCFKFGIYIHSYGVWDSINLCII